MSNNTHVQNTANAIKNLVEVKISSQIQVIEEETQITEDGIYLKTIPVALKAVANISNANTTVAINLTGYYGITDNILIIDWGDGTVENIDYSTISGYRNLKEHTYTDSGNYTVKIKGKITTLQNTVEAGYELLSEEFISAEVGKTVTTLKASFYNCSNLTEVILPDNITIGMNAFGKCSSLTSINLTSNMQFTGGRCFTDTGLTSLIIPSGITSLPGVFAGYSPNLRCVSIPSSVTEIGQNAFDSCNSLVDYQLYWENNPVSYSSNKMPNNPNAIFTIPYGTTQLYVDAGYPSDKLRERSE